MDTSFARIWLRFEGLATLVAAALLYHHFGLRWFWFGVLFLAPDLSMLGYLAGPRLGALAYNLAHSYAAALVVLAAGLVAGLDGAPRLALLGVGLIWCAHIGFDRALGYGLKSPEGFRLTHLGKIGRNQPPQTPARL
ncbi:MAG: DUF4260 domain-containing protein [Lacunisphaera sp.]|nr:DUF4260 domain-containing protein [Lacunisphaera sp.]